MKKIIKILVMILVFCNPCFSMQQDHIPTLREIAFKQSVPKINQQIDIIIDRNTEILEKLKNIHDLIDLYCLPKKFIKEHAVINRLVEKCVANSYNKMQDDSDLKIKLWNSFDSIPHFRKKLQGQMSSIFLTQDQNCLPPLCIVGMPVYALCLLNNRMLFMPLNKIVAQLCSEKSFLSTAQSLENKAGAVINRNHQAAISQLQSNFPHNEVLQYVFRSYIAYKDDSKSITSDPDITIASDLQQKINDITIIYSHDGKKIMFAELNKLTIQNIGEDISLSTTVDMPGPIKKACFSADDSTIFVATDAHFCTYNIDQAEIRRWSQKNIIAMHPTQGKDLLIVKHEGDKVKLQCIEIKNLTLSITTTTVFFITKEPAAITAACFSKNGKWIAIGCRNGKIHLLKRESEKQKNISLDLDEAVTQIIFSPCGSFLTAIVNDRIVYTWHFASGKLIKQFCPKVVHTIEAHDETGLFKGKKCYNYCLPLILLSFSIDGDHPIIQELCDNNRAEGWQKRINPLELIFSVKNSQNNNLNTLNDLQNSKEKTSIFRYMWGVSILLGAIIIYGLMHR